VLLLWMISRSVLWVNVMGRMNGWLLFIMVMCVMRVVLSIVCRVFRFLDCFFGNWCICVWDVGC